MFIAGTRRSETAVKLAICLRDCEGGYNIPPMVDFLVNYGRVGVNANLNSHLVLNKMRQLELFKLSNLPVPPFWKLTPEIIRRFRFMSKREAKNYFPLFARKYRHTKGSDILVLNSPKDFRRKRRRLQKRDYLIQVIDKVKEFRLHVLGEKVVGISYKTKKEDEFFHDPLIWSRPKGWIQLDYSENGYQEELKELGINALKALGYDFGAVDIILGKDGKLYLLEVNSAPRLNLRRRRLYAKFFRKQFNKFKRELENED